MKKTICFILVFLFIFSSTSCAAIDRFKGDMNRLDSDEDGNLIYNGNTYYSVDDRFVVHVTDGDAVVELGWYSQFPFFPDMHYYAFELDDPVFIFCENKDSSIYTKGLYVRSDYDIYSALYTVENTDIEISLKSALWESHLEVSEIEHEESCDFIMCLKDDPRVQLDLSGPYPHGNHYYLIRSGKTFTISDELVALLKSASVIPA